MQRTSSPGEQPERDAHQLTCPNCGAALVFDADSGRFSCEFCLSNFTRQELSGDRLSQKQREDEEYSRGLHEYACPSCGAEIVTDLDTVADFCAYCGNPVVLKGEVQGEVRPDLIIPFAFGKEQAQQKLVQYLKHKLYVPKSFFQQANLDKITGIYHPFWETDLDTDCCLQAQGTHTNVWISGNKRYTRTKFYDIWRRGEIHFEDISTNALQSADKQLVEGILPYPIEAHQAFDMRYLSGFYAKKCTIARHQVQEEVRTKMRDYAQTLLRDTIAGYDTVTVKRNAVQVENAHWDYTLLPIWVLCYHYRKKTYTFAVNGVTGKVFGELPVSRVKLGITWGAIAAGVTALLSLLGGLIL